MAMPACGTFHYVTSVPPRDRWGDWVVDDASGAKPDAADVDPLLDRRLVGLRPRLIVDGRRLTLHARDLPRASVRSASFDLDEDLLDMVRAGDRLVLIRTACADLGVSVLRDDALVFAAGALPALALGTGTHADAVFPPGIGPFACARGDVRLSTPEGDYILPIGQDVAVGHVRACLLQQPQLGIPGTLGVGAICGRSIPLAAVKRAAGRMTDLEMMGLRDESSPGRVRATASRIRGLFARD